MEIVLASIAFLVAAACAGLMGFAIQRGATCTVAAVDEAVEKRRFRRLRSMLEASLWVAAGLLVARALGVLGKMPSGYAVSTLTIGGGALLGLGAFVNRACVFGAIARLGSGEWAYAMTPLGFFVGCVTLNSLFAPDLAQKLPFDSPVLTTPAWVVVPVAAFLGWRLLRALRKARSGPASERSNTVWSPHAATIVIGVTFVVMLLLVGAWAYTDALAELARGMASNLPARALLLVALFTGALVGGWTAGRWRNARPPARQFLQCFAGGVLMGWGSLLIPGGNDGLILVGMPLLWPYAWLAFAAMCTTIALAMAARRTLAGASAFGRAP